MGRKRVPDWWRNTSAEEIQEAETAGVSPEDYRWYLEMRRQILGQSDPSVFSQNIPARLEGFTIHPIGASWLYNLWHGLGTEPDPTMELDFSVYVLGVTMASKKLPEFLREIPAFDKSRFEALIAKLTGTLTIASRERQLSSEFLRLARAKIEAYNT